MDDLIISYRLDGFSSAFSKRRRLSCTPISSKRLDAFHVHALVIESIGKRSGVVALYYVVRISINRGKRNYSLTLCPEHVPAYR